MQWLAVLFTQILSSLRVKNLETLCNFLRLFLLLRLTISLCYATENSKTYHCSSRQLVLTSHNGSRITNIRKLTWQSNHYSPPAGMYMWKAVQEMGHYQQPLWVHCTTLTLPNADQFSTQLQRDRLSSKYVITKHPIASWMHHHAALCYFSHSQWPATCYFLWHPVFWFSHVGEELTGKRHVLWHVLTGGFWWKALLQFSK